MSILQARDAEELRFFVSEVLEKEPNWAAQGFAWQALTLPE